MNGRAQGFSLHTLDAARPLPGTMPAVFSALLAAATLTASSVAIIALLSLDAARAVVA
jgi:hypothetical protein